MACLSFRQEMEATGLPSWINKVPSPSGSDDSGVGLSPSPTNCDQRFHLDSPGRNKERHYVVKGFGKEFAEEASKLAYNYEEAKSCVSHLDLPDTRNSNKVASQFIDQLKPFLSDNERYIAASLCNSPTENTCPKSRNRKKTPTTEHSTSSKRDRCLQPKTGNGKPRQTSAKRKMNQKSKRNAYSGVRVQTVRQLLQNRREPKRQAKLQLSELPNGRPHDNEQMTKHMFPSRSDTLPEGFNAAASFMDVAGTTLHQMPLASHSSFEELTSNSCTSFSNITSPPNVTLPTSMHQPPVVPTPNYTMEHSMPSQSSCFHAQQLDMYPPTNHHYVPSTYLNPDQSDSNHVLKTMPYSSYQSMLANDPQFVENYQDLNQPATPQPMFQTTSAVQMFRNDQAYSQIHDLAAVGDIRQLQDLVLMKPDLVLSKDSSGLLPIFCAVKNNQVEAVRVLLIGSPHKYAAPDGMTLLHEAAQQSNPAILDLLLNSLSEWETLELINRKSMTSGGVTPLHIATEAGHIENMNLLLEHGADAAAKSDQSWTTPLHIAVKNANLIAVQTLVEFSKTGLRKFDIDVALAKQVKKINVKDEPLPLVTCRKDRSGNAPLHLAAELQATHGPVIVQLQQQIICYLLENGANPSVMNAEFKTPSQLLPPIGSFPQSRELHSLLGTVLLTTNDAISKPSAGFFGLNLPTLDMNRSPLHQVRGGQHPHGSEDPFPN